MDNENSPLAASAENTAKRKLITQPLIVALLAGFTAAQNAKGL